MSGISIDQLFNPDFKTTVKKEDTSVDDSIKKDDPPKKDKIVKDEKTQIRELAEAKKRLELENADLKKKFEENQKLSKLSPIADYLDKKHGKVDDESVNIFIEKNRSRKKQLEEKERIIKEKDGALKQLSIFESDEWKQDYQAPVEQSRDLIFANIANTDSEGNVKNPELINSLYQQITQLDKDGNHLSSLKIKAIVKKFSDDYVQKTGEEYDVPRINDIVDSVNQLSSRVKKANAALHSWKEVQEQKSKEKAFEDQKKKEALLKREIEGTEYVFSQAVNQFDYKSIDNIFDRDEVKERMENYHNEIKSIKKGDRSAFEYDDLLTKLSKADLFDALVSKYRDLEKKLEEEYNIVNSGLGSSSDDPTKRRENEPKKLKIGEDPMSIFNR